MIKIRRDTFSKELFRMMKGKGDKEHEPENMHITTSFQKKIIRVGTISIVNVCGKCSESVEVGRLGSCRVELNIHIL